MNSTFKQLTNGLHEKYMCLINMEPVTVKTVPLNTPKGGVYLFSENGINLYVGRTKRKIKDRLKDHVSTADDCPFAWHLAREETGQRKASYKKEGSRKHLLSQPGFKTAYERAKKRISKMDVRFVEESDSLKQALLEIYIAVITKAEFNDFDTH